MDFAGIASNMFSPIFSFIGNGVVSLLSLALSFLIFFVGFFFLRYKINPFKMNADKLREPYIKMKYYDLLRWLLVDFLERGLHKNEFREYGFTFYVGRQGSGKTSSMVHYLELMKERYPNVIIVSNFAYYRADFIMVDWRDIMNIRNGEDGVIFAIDEIHSEYNSTKWKDVPEDLLREISQERKQRVKIVATAQFYSDIAKPLRKQAMTVVTCSTWLKRLVDNRTYDSIDYARVVDNVVTVGKKLRPMFKTSFVLSDALRSCFDTYEKIERMKKIEFIPRDQRGE